MTMIMFRSPVNLFSLHAQRKVNVSGGNTPFPLTTPGARQTHRR
ncbi:hypothetical protein HMPREF0201_02305 [Cedecea davisae DSM 4568]|uniref:Uncharacterized protein n=1 Tax=Cedecea davisae DSM 4568 TaxID=566551 RepID=S3IVT1_9ENTR|nr:hypothetical protein HMPREF0201_02305 [Cedecea davisae DSM 4568]